MAGDYGLFDWRKSTGRRRTTGLRSLSFNVAIARGRDDADDDRKAVARITVDTLRRVEEALDEPP